MWSCKFFIVILIYLRFSLYFRNIYIYYKTKRVWSNLASGLNESTRQLLANGNLSGSSYKWTRGPPATWLIINTLNVNLYLKAIVGRLWNNTLFTYSKFRSLRSEIRDAHLHNRAKWYKGIDLTLILDIPLCAFIFMQIAYWNFLYA